MKIDTFHEIDLNCSFLTPERLDSNSKTLISYVSSQVGEINNFWSAIKELQSSDTLLTRKKDTTEIIFYNHDLSHLTSAMLNLMALKPEEGIPREIEYSTDEQISINTKIKDALNLLEEVFPNIFPHFNNLIPFIIVGRLNGFFGGSVSNRIGFIWLSPIEEWNYTDIAEQLFHEFIHNALFLEEMVNTVMPFTAVRMEEEDGLITSSIRQVKRGYDKSYHAAFVAYGLICFYVKIGQNKKALTFLNPLLISLDELIRNQNFLSERGIFLLDELCENVLEKKDMFDI